MLPNFIIRNMEMIVHSIDIALILWADKFVEKLCLPTVESTISKKKNVSKSQLIFAIFDLFFLEMFDLSVQNL